MSIADDIADGLAEIEADFGATWTPKSGTAIPVLAGTFKTSAALSIGGFASDADAIINIRVSLLAAAPTVNTTGTYTGPEFPNGKTFRIDKVNPSPGFVQLELIDPSKGV